MISDRYPFGFGIAPLVLAPFSEAYGRNLLYLVSAFVYAILYLPQALAKDIVLVIIVRFLSGCAGSTGETNKRKNNSLSEANFGLQDLLWSEELCPTSGTQQIAEFQCLYSQLEPSQELVL
jgi:MFS family permease